MAAAAATTEPLLPRPAGAWTLRIGAAGVLTCGALVACSWGVLPLRPPSLSGGRVIDPAPTRKTVLAEQSFSPKVKVELYGMAGCPFTRAFIEGPLTEMLTTVPDLVDFELVAFGNSYFVTTECGGSASFMPFAGSFKGYDSAKRHCWERLCGATAAVPAADCFSGALVCQHGATDGMVTAAWACAKDSARGMPDIYMPFARCTAQHFLAMTSQETYEQTLRDCAASSGLEVESVLPCATGSRGRDLLVAEARATVEHGSVPYVLVDGKLLENTACVACGDGIMVKVCQAWRSKPGAEPSPVCDSVLAR